MDARDPRLVSLLATLGPEASPASLQLVADAFDWAARLHAGQVRADGCAVFDHVVGVAENVLAAGERDPELVAAALLHDVAERTPVTAAAIGERLGPRIGRLVAVLTKRPTEDAASAAQRAVEAGREAVLLRLCDRLDGLRHHPARQPADRDHYLVTTRRVYLPLANEHFPSIAAALRALLDRVGPEPSEV